MCSSKLFALGFVRVKETDDEVLVDAPRNLTRCQRKFVADKTKGGKTVVVNKAEFVGTRGR